MRKSTYQHLFQSEGATVLHVTPVENLAPRSVKFSWGTADECLRCSERFLAGIGGAGLFYCRKCQAWMRFHAWRDYDRPIPEEDAA